MAGQRIAASRPRGRPADDVGQRPIVPQEIQVHRRQAVERSSFVARDRDRLEKHFGQHHRRSAIQVDAVLEARRPHDTKYLKSRRLPSPIAAPDACGCMWMMSVPIATCTVTGICSRHAVAATLICANGGLTRVEILPDRLAEPESRGHAVVDRAIQLRAGLLRHAERARAERRVDVFRGAARQRDLEIVNDARAVGRDRRDEPALHQIDEHRRQAGLQHVRAESPDDRLVRRASPRRSPSTTSLKSCAASRSGSDFMQPADARARLVGRRKLREAHLALPRAQRIGLDAGQIEFFVGQSSCG